MASMSNQKSIGVPVRKTACISLGCGKIMVDIITIMILQKLQVCDYHATMPSV